tara:strand:- start:5733 stop:7049 length:1317 start_codon:yes stop_codon:yes gene_type:complete
MKSYRKSSRTYSNKEISYEFIREIINKAINYAPSSCNHQMWHFIAVDDKSMKEKISRISAQSHFLEASWIIFISTHYGWNHNKFSVIQSAAAATQMILYYADEDGLVGCWNAGIGNTSKIKKLLKIDKSFGVLGALTIGYPGNKSNFEIKASKRKVDDVLSRNIFKRERSSIYPLRHNEEPCFWKAMNNNNNYSIHNPHKWTFNQISNFRSFSVFAKSPFPTTYFSKRYKLELEQELFGSKNINQFIQDKSKLKILEILPYGGQYTNFLSNKKNSNISVAEYSENNFKYIQSRLVSQNLKKVDFIKINHKGRILNEGKIFDIVYCLQSLEEYPKPNILISEIKRICKKDEYIVFSIRNLFSWYGFHFYLKTRKNQVPNFGPHIPLNPIKSLISIKNNFKIIDIYGISPLPNKAGKKITNLFLKYFCRLFVIVCKKKES